MAMTPLKATIQHGAGALREKPPLAAGCMSAHYFHMVFCSITGCCRVAVDQLTGFLVIAKPGQGSACDVEVVTYSSCTQKEALEIGQLSINL